MKQLVSLLRTTAKPCIMGARLNHGQEKARAEPAAGNRRTDVNAAGPNFGQRTEDGCPSPSWGSLRILVRLYSAVPRGARHRGRHHRPSRTAVGQARLGAILSKPALHDGQVLTDVAGLYHPQLWRQGNYWSCDIILWHHSVTSHNLELDRSGWQLHVYVYTRISPCMSHSVKSVQ